MSGSDFCLCWCARGGRERPTATRLPVSFLRTCYQDSTLKTKYFKFLVCYSSPVMKLQGKIWNSGRHLCLGCPCSALPSPPVDHRALQRLRTCTRSWQLLGLLSPPLLLHFTSEKCLSSSELLNCLFIYRFLLSPPLTVRYKRNERNFQCYESSTHVTFRIQLTIGIFLNALQIKNCEHPILY